MVKKFTNLAGKKIGYLTVLDKFEERPLYKNGKNAWFWLCKCICGKEKFISFYSLKKTKSCGCKNPKPPCGKKEKFLATRKKLFRSCRHGAHVRNLEFKLTLETFIKIIERQCSYCGVLFSMEDKCFSTGEMYKHNGVDRRDNDAGYTDINSVPCCKYCNIAKGTRSEKEFLEQAKKIVINRKMGIVKNALITGVFGQDGSTLAEILLSKGYVVIGVNRRSSDRNPWRIKHLLNNPNFILETGDITDSSSIYSLVKTYLPSEFYHLAANSFVGDSWNLPTATLNNIAIGTTNCLEAIRNIKSDTKFYNAASSEMYGRVLETPQNENTKFNPLSPYAAAKLCAFEMTKIYRESFNIFACSGILFNHEGAKRSKEFITRKISDAVARIKIAGRGQLVLGKIDSKRDWGWANDYCEAMYLMLQQSKADDYVISTDETHSVEEFLEEAFGYVGLNWKDYVIQDEKYFRPLDVNLLLGDSSKARRVLGWKPTVDFRTLVRMMVDADMERVRYEGR